MANESNATPPVGADDAALAIARLAAALKALGQAAAVVQTEAVKLAHYLEQPAQSGSAVDAPFVSVADATDDSPALSLQDPEMRRRYFAGQPPRDEAEASLYQALRESERQSQLAQGFLVDDDSD